MPFPKPQKTYTIEISEEQREALQLLLEKHAPYNQLSLLSTHDKDHCLVEHPLLYMDGMIKDIKDDTETHHCFWA